MSPEAVGRFARKTASVTSVAAPHMAPPLTTACHSLQRRAGRCWPRPPAQAIGRAPLRLPMGTGHAPTAGNRTWKVTIGCHGWRPRLSKLSIGCVFGVVRCYWAEWCCRPPSPSSLPPTLGLIRGRGRAPDRSEGIADGAGQVWECRAAAALGALLLLLRPP